jgi:lipid-A-disaccharide synthase
MYRVAWATYWIARMITDVPFIAMPNLLANRRVFPEFIQGDATPERLAAEAADLLNNPARRAQVKRELDAVVAALGPPGACERAAEAIAGLLR